MRACYLAALVMLIPAVASADPVPVETDTLSNTHDVSALPPVAERIPEDPLVVDLEDRDRELGRHGGELNTLVGRSKDARLVNVWGYARLVGYNEELELVPDILEDIEVEDGRIFTLHLREGHRWSDGHPFTAEDIRYFWEDIALNKELAPSGPEPFLKVDGELATFEMIDEETVRFSWSEPNPEFLPNLAKARDPFIYRPAHYLKQFHADYGDAEAIAALVEERKVRNWAALHNQLDDLYGATNADQPTLQPWVLARDPENNRAVFHRNPFYHRIDENGRQLPYIDKIIITVADSKLIAAKTQAGESDLQARGLSFSDVTILKRAEAESGLKLHLWPEAKAAHFALYPNMTTRDEVWRAVLRDVRVRRGLSLGIDRVLINRTLYFGLAEAAQNTATPPSPLYDAERAASWTDFDPDRANALLDEAGLDKRRGDGTRLLPDGRPFELIVESAGESQEELDVLELVSASLKDVGVNLYIKASQRDVLRARALSGDLVMGVWSGFDNGVPTPEMMPIELAPTNAEQLHWPGFGAYIESGGNDGTAIDMPEVARLVELYRAWQNATDDDDQARIWSEMLNIHADQVFTIGLIGGVRQPVVAVPSLRNVPADAFYGWDPGAQYGLWRMDEFWFDE